MEPKATKLDGQLSVAAQNPSAHDERTAVNLVISDNTSDDDRKILMDAGFKTTVDALGVICGNMPTKNLTLLEKMEFVRRAEANNKRFATVGKIYTQPDPTFKVKFTADEDE